jgi:hypothetical protein
MPNGHGGRVRFFPVIVLALFLGGLLVYARKTGAEWAIYAGYGVAVLAGERFAHHLHLWHVDEYVDWSDEEKAAARKIYIVGAIIYVIGALAAWNLLTTK